MCVPGDPAEPRGGLLVDTASMGIRIITLWSARTQRREGRRGKAGEGSGPQSLTGGSVKLGAVLGMECSRRYVVMLPKFTKTVARSYGKWLNKNCQGVSPKLLL